MDLILKSSVNMLSAVIILLCFSPKRSCLVMQGGELQPWLPHLVNHNDSLSDRQPGLVSGQGPTQRMEGGNKNG